MNIASHDDSDAPISLAFVLHFDGEVPREGLDADEVASVADGVAKAVQFIAEQSLESHHPRVLHLTEVKPGSATFHFLLQAAAITQTVFPLLMEGQFSIKQFGEIFSATLKFFEFLDGKPPQSVSVAGGDKSVNVTNSQGATTKVNHYTYNLVINNYYHDQVKKSVKPLKKKQRTLVIKNDKKILHQTTSDNYNDFTVKYINDNEPVNISIIEATLKVKKPDLEDDNSWRFWWGRNVITAQLADADFMQKVRAGTEDFRSGDVFVVKLRIEERQKRKNLTKKHYIDEIISRHWAG